MKFFLCVGVGVDEKPTKKPIHWQSPGVFELNRQTLFSPPYGDEDDGADDDDDVILDGCASDENAAPGRKSTVVTDRLGLRCWPGAGGTVKELFVPSFVGISELQRGVVVCVVSPMGGRTLSGRGGDLGGDPGVGDAANLGAARLYRVVVGVVQAVHEAETSFVPGDLAWLLGLDGIRHRITLRTCVESETAMLPTRLRRTVDRLAALPEFGRRGVSAPVEICLSDRREFDEVHRRAAAALGRPASLSALDFEAVVRDSVLFQVCLHVCACARACVCACVCVSLCVCVVGLFETVVVVVDCGGLLVILWIQFPFLTAAAPRSRCDRVGGGRHGAGI